MAVYKMCIFCGDQKSAKKYMTVTTGHSFNISPLGIWKKKYKFDWTQTVRE